METPLMHSLRYLNTILTLLALLLTLNLWTAWTASPAGNALTLTERAEAQGVVNAGAQRKEIIDLLKKVNVSLSGIDKKLSDGNAKVQVVGDPEQKQQD
ncbi:MAG: hypothetical protein ACODAQ_03280 [Phycisphaeraceae bacterium]